MFPEIDLKKEILDIFTYFQNEILKKEEKLKNTREKYIEKRDFFLKKIFEEDPQLKKWNCRWYTFMYVIQHEIWKKDSKKTFP